MSDVRRFLETFDPAGTWTQVLHGAGPVRTSTGASLPATWRPGQPLPRPTGCASIRVR